jgi:hypothetical protein
MGCGDNAIGIGLKIVIYFNIPSLGHSLFDFLVSGISMLTKTLTLISHFSKCRVLLEIGLQHISASA